MRKIVASVSLMMCLSATASAMDYRTDSHNNLLHTIGWEQKNMALQKKTFSDLHSQLKRLEIENEQLRNSINKIVAGNRSAAPSGVDTRIQALVEENKRLTNLLKQKDTVNTPSASSGDVYARKIAALKNENQELMAQINALSGQRQNDNSGALKAYKEENTLLKEALNQRDNGADRIVVLQRQIQSLKSENKRLLESETQSASLHTDADMREKEALIVSLQGTVKALQVDNRKLGLAVAEASEKALNYSDRATEARSAYDNNMKALDTLKEQLSQVQDENSRLKETVAGRTGVSSQAKEQIATLQKQNQSLRDTISAQNEALVSSDNAAKTAERLLVENGSLKRELESADKSSSANGETAQQLLERVKVLQGGIVQRDNYIKKLDGLKDTVKLLREENDRYAQGASRDQSASVQISTLASQNEALEAALNQERENIIAYRTKIKEYQDEIASAKNARANNSSKAALESLGEKLDAAHLENQELKARIDLLSKNAESVVFQKDASFKTKRKVDTAASLNNVDESSEVVFAHEKKNIIATGNSIKMKGTYTSTSNNVRYVDTPYPPVDEVLPVLGVNGVHLEEAEDDTIATSVQAAASVEDMAHDPVVKNYIKPEELLAQELSPLSDK